MYIFDYKTMINLFLLVFIILFHIAALLLLVVAIRYGSLDTVLCFSLDDS